MKIFLLFALFKNLIRERENYGIGFQHFVKRYLLRDKTRHDGNDISTTQRNYKFTKVIYIVYIYLASCLFPCKNGKFL